MRIIQLIALLTILTSTPVLSTEFSIFELIQKNYIEALGTRLKDTDQLELQNEKGETPVFFASRLDRIDALILLLDAGADANTVNYKGYSALTQAISSKHEAVVRELIRAGADIYSVDSFSISPIQRMTDPTCHGTYVHWGKETEQLLNKTTNNTLDDFTWPETIKHSCPMIRMSQKNISDGKWVSWRHGYQSMPSGSAMEDGQLVLECEVDIKNKSAGLRIKNHIFDSCEYSESSWSCSDTSGIINDFSVPEMFAEVVGESDFQIKSIKSYSYQAYNGLNQQPNGDVILSARFKDLPLQVAHLKLSSGFTIDSCKIFRGAWHCKK